MKGEPGLSRAKGRMPAADFVHTERQYDLSLERIPAAALFRIDFRDRSMAMDQLNENPALMAKSTMTVSLNRTYIFWTALSAMVGGILAAYATHTLAIRTDLIVPPVQRFGTVYLNELFGQPTIVGEDLEIDPESSDPRVARFSRAIVERVRRDMKSRLPRYDVWLTGFERARGWPFVSHKSYADVFIDEYGEDGVRIVEQRHLKTDFDGQYPTNILGFLLNTGIFAAAFSVLFMTLHASFDVIVSRYVSQCAGFSIVS